MTEEIRSRRATKKPAWLLDNVDPTAADVEGEPRPRPQHKRSSQTDSAQKPSTAASKQHAPEKHHRPDMPRRMCLNPACKSPFESPQWRRGPLGPGTLCNACGTRYARIEAKKRGEKKGGSRLRPQDLAEWQAFEEQLQHPPDVQQAWRAHTSRLVTQLQQREQLIENTADFDDEAAQQQYEYDDELEEHDEELQHTARPLLDSSFQQDVLLPREHGSNSRAAEGGHRANIGAAAESWGLSGRSKQQQQPGDMPQASGRASPCQDDRQQSPYHEQHGRVKRRQRRFNEDASDSQEAAACSYPEIEDGGLSGGSRRADHRPGGEGVMSAGDQFLHLLAVGEAMIKTEGVAPEDRKEAWEEYVEKRLPAEQHTHQPSHAADSGANAKRSRFKAEVEERQAVGPEQGPTKNPVPPKDRFERLLAEAEQCIRARSASPLLRPVTPQFDILADATRAGQTGSAPAAAADGAAASVVLNTAADRSPLPRTSRLGDAGRQAGTHGAFPPHLELPAAATTATTVAGSRLCAGALLGTSAAAAAQHCSAGGHSSRLERLQQGPVQQVPADSDSPHSKALLTDEELEHSPACDDPLQPQQQHDVGQLQEELQRNRQEQLQRLAQLGLQAQPNPQAALLAQLQGTGGLHACLQRLLDDVDLCAVLACCLADPVTTTWLGEMLQANLERHAAPQQLAEHPAKLQQQPGTANPSQQQQLHAVTHQGDAVAGYASDGGAAQPAQGVLGPECASQPVNSAAGIGQRQLQAPASEPAASLKPLGSKSMDHLVGLQMGVQVQVVAVDSDVYDRGSGPKPAASPSGNADTGGAACSSQSYSGSSSAGAVDATAKDLLGSEKSHLQPIPQQQLQQQGKDQSGATTPPVVAAATVGTGDATASLGAASKPPGGKRKRACTAGHVVDADIGEAGKAAADARV